MSEFRIRVTHVSGRNAILVPGGQGERDLVADILARVKAKGVGVGRTEAHVLADVEAALNDALYAIKAEVLPHG
jgi:hypothetical protein